MTTPDEEQRTIAQTRDFLFFLLHCKPGEIKFIRTESHRLLKHYPILPRLRKGDQIIKCNGGLSMVLRAPIHSISTEQLRAADSMRKCNGGKRTRE